jgi:hypothetical protein
MAITPFVAEARDASGNFSSFHLLPRLVTFDAKVLLITPLCAPATILMGYKLRGSSHAQFDS